MPARSAGVPSAAMRLVTFNILNGRAPGAERVDPDALAAAVRALDPDVLALQEVDRNQERSAHADLTAVAAEAMGAEEHRFVAALAGSPGATWTAATGDEQPDSAAYGVALLSRRPVSSWEVVRLPGVPVRAPWRFHDRRLPTWVHDEPRVAVAAQVDAPGGCVTVATTHLSFLRYWNGRQLRQLVTSLSDVPRPLVLTGDLNMGPDRAARITGLRSAAAHLTFPVQAPTEQIDHVLVDGDLRVLASEARRLPVSDHLALVVDLADGD